MAGAISLQRQPEAQERLPFVRKSGNSGKNSNGTVHPSGIFSGKKWLYLRMYYFSFARFYCNDRIFLYHLFWITRARISLERKRKIYWYFVNDTTQCHFCFRCDKKNASTI